MFDNLNQRSIFECIIGLKHFEILLTCHSPSGILCQEDLISQLVCLPVGDVDWLPVGPGCLWALYLSLMSLSNQQVRQKERPQPSGQWAQTETLCAERVFPHANPKETPGFMFQQINHSSPSALGVTAGCGE